MVPEILLYCISLLPACVLVALDRSLFLEMLADIRIGRILHYFILFLFGFTLYTGSWEHALETASIAWDKGFLYFLSLVYAAVFAIASNNREDLEIDRISNPDRPLVKGTVNVTKYLFVARTSLVVSLLIACWAGPVFLAAIAAISGVYFLYSCRPFRLKRFVFLAKFLIGTNTLISAVCGFVAAGGAFADFPAFWLFFILVPVSLMANFVDLKDTVGDRLAGIRTLPVLLGDTNAKYLISLFTVAAYALVLAYFGSVWILLAVLPVCAVHLFLLLKKNYLEKPLFLLHNSLFLGLIVLQLVNHLLPE